MAKFDEKLRFLRDAMAEIARKNVRKWLENALGTSRAGQVFQKVTVDVSLVKQSVRQNEMGGGQKIAIRILLFRIWQVVFLHGFKNIWNAVPPSLYDTHIDKCFSKS